jgi:hypothetical protein
VETGASIPWQAFSPSAYGAILGRAGAVLGVFTVSGLIHDLVITVPAGGGLRFADSLLCSARRALLF